MKITEIVLERIKDNHELDAYVKGTVAKISNHITSNKMIFFPEYTDHDITHFEAVLDTAIDLATENSRSILSDVDFAILTASVMLHDLGMHLTKDGFQTLISPNGPLKPIEGFGDLPWNELWVSFLAEARRFDANKLEALFGENYKPVTKFPAFSDPWSEFDNLLVGEFLRRHHPRLAHEIALHGMPSIEGSVVCYCAAKTEHEKFLSDISGLVARSHGLPLRQTFPYLEKKYNSKIETRSAHPVYLMSLLRIADYLQIQSERAPTSRTQVSKFYSPISTREWSVHQCVSDITNLTDPEAIDITAKPEDVDTFLRLKHWVEDLQRELDTSWAVLGEVYGLQTHSGLSELGLRVRRIKSNIDDTESFGKTVRYIPEHITFSTAGSELLTLLVGPLYANDISVGLRELVQNATDAVKEINQLVSDGSLSEPIPRPDISGDVQIDFELFESEKTNDQRKVKKIVITDRGVGMTQEIVQNFFLKAGASFRNSDAWKESFKDPQGQVKVQRSGRFGVGALAAFLLGDKISVETRHYLEPEENGLKFSTSIETHSINIVRHKCYIGTKIEIEVPKRFRNRLNAILPSRFQNKVSTSKSISQYMGRTPRLIYTIGGKEIPWDEECYLPSKSNRYEDPWSYFETNDFEVNWTFSSKPPDLSVNQIRVANGDQGRYSQGSMEWSFSSSIFNFPKLAIGDKSGSFPLNLQRSSYAAPELPFRDELAKDITDEFIFCCLRKMLADPQLEFPTYQGQDSGTRYQPKEHIWIHCSDGIILNNLHFLNAYEPSYAFMRYGGRSEPQVVNNLISAMPGKVIFIHDANDQFSARNYKMKGKLTRILQGRAFDYMNFRTASMNAYVPQSFVASIFSEMKPGIEARKLLEALELDDEKHGWLAQREPNLEEPREIRDWRMTLEKNGSNTSVICLHKLSSAKIETKKNNDVVVFNRWMELLGSPYIPNSRSEILQLLNGLKGQFGDKFDVYWRRTDEDQAKTVKV